VSLVLVPADPPAHQSMSEFAYRAIRRLICTAELAPGSVISEASLAAALGVGRTPVREALRTLAAEHLIDIYPRRGMFVAGVDPRNLRALSEVRERLEPFAAGLAAQRRDDSDVVEIDTIELDQRIHQQVYACAQNEFLASVLDEHYVHALRIWFLALEHVRNLPQAVAEHRAILAAIRDADPDGAALAMGEHVRGFEAQMRQWL